MPQSTSTTTTRNNSTTSVDIINVQDFDAKGDGISDDYPCLLAAVKKINELGKGILYFPRGVYYIAPHISTSNPIQNLLFAHCNGLTIEGNHSIIKMNGHFHRVVEDEHEKNGTTYYYSNSSTVCPFVFDNCQNIEVANLELDGGIRQMSRDDKIAEGRIARIPFGGDGIRIQGNSKNISLKNIFAHHFQRDGIYLRQCKDVKIERCKSYNNARQGMSVTTGCEDIISNNSDFSYSGHTEGKYKPHPGYIGVDIEQESTFPIQNIHFYNCRFVKNKGYQVVASGKNIKNVSLNNCYIEDNALGYNGVVNGINLGVTDAKIDACLVFASIGTLGGEENHSLQITNNSIYSGNSALESKKKRLVTIDHNYFYRLPNRKVITFIALSTRNPLSIFTNNNIIIEDETTDRCNIVGCKKAANNIWRINEHTPNGKIVKIHYRDVAEINGEIHFGKVKPKY